MALGHLRQFDQIHCQQRPVKLCINLRYSFVIFVVLYCCLINWVLELWASWRREERVVPPKTCNTGRLPHHQMIQALKHTSSIWSLPKFLFAWSILDIWGPFAFSAIFFCCPFRDMIALKKQEYSQRTFAGTDPYPSGCDFVFLPSLDSVKIYDLEKSASTCGELPPKDAALLLLLLMTACTGRLFCLNTYNTEVPTDDHRCILFCNCLYFRFAFQRRQLHC